MLDIETSVGKSRIQGMGLFALRDFKPGEVVVAWDTSNTLSNDEYERLPEDQRQYVVRYEGGWLYMLPPGRYINHSCDPNSIPLHGNDVAIRDIHLGDEITSDYRPVMPLGERMECKCGASNCMGYIIGTAL